MVVVFYFWGRERPDEPAAAREGVLRRETGTRTPISHLRLVVAMGLIYFAFKFLRYALESWSPMIVQEHFGRGPAFSAYATSAFDWLGFTGVLAAGWLSDRWFGSRRTPVIFGMSCGALAGALLLWGAGLSSVWMFVLLLAVIGFMDMGPDSLLAGTAAVEAGDPRQAAVSAAIINGLGSIGPIFQEELIGWVKTDYGLGPVLLILVGIAGLATASTGLLWWQSPRL